jgi:hypothetical protein
MLFDWLDMRLSDLLFLALVWVHLACQCLLNYVRDVSDVVLVNSDECLYPAFEVIDVITKFFLSGNESLQLRDQWVFLTSVLKSGQDLGTQGAFELAGETTLALGAPLGCGEGFRATFIAKQLVDEAGVVFGEEVKIFWCAELFLAGGGVLAELNDLPLTLAKEPLRSSDLHERIFVWAVLRRDLSQGDITVLGMVNRWLPWLSINYSSHPQRLLLARVKLVKIA